MRNFACKASKALFFADLDYTYNFRNDCIEFIVKEDRGVYGVLNLIPCEDGWQVIARFGALFEIIGDKKAMKKISPDVPTLAGLVENEGHYDGLSLLNQDGTLVLGKLVAYKGDDLLDSLTSAPLRKECIQMARQCFQLFMELLSALDKYQLDPWRGRMLATFDL